MIRLPLWYLNNRKEACNCLSIELLEDSVQRRFPGFDDINRYNIAFKQPLFCADFTLSYRNVFVTTFFLFLSKII